VSSTKYLTRAVFNKSLICYRIHQISTSIKHFAALSICES